MAADGGHVATSRLRGEESRRLRATAASLYVLLLAAARALRRRTAAVQHMCESRPAVSLARRRCGAHQSDANCSSHEESESKQARHLQPHGGNPSRTNRLSSSAVCAKEKEVLPRQRHRRSCRRRKHHSGRRPRPLALLAGVARLWALQPLRSSNCESSCSHQRCSGSTFLSPHRRRQPPACFE